MQIEHLRAQTHLLLLSDKMFSVLEWSNNRSPPLPALALILFQQEIAPRVGLPRVSLATLAPGGAQVLFVVCLAEE